MMLPVRRRTAAALAAYTAVLSLAGAARSQTQRKEPFTFAVASIKPTPPDERRGIVHQLPGNQVYEVIGAPLSLIMTVAYTVTNRQISGGPDWINTERWNIEAKAERSGTSDEMHDALARLLEDRFQLKIRHETRDLPCYILSVDKKGPKMPVHDAKDLAHEPIGGNPIFSGLTGHNVTMDYFAFILSRMLDLNVIDRTGLTDQYDIVNFKFIPDNLPPGGIRLNGEPVAVPDGPSIYTALREQLGLQLQKGKGPVDFLVIEHVEKPTEN